MEAPLTLSYDLTAAYDGVSCIKEVYPLHIILAYIVTISGIGAILSRIKRKYHIYHMWFGRVFLIALMWTAASSTLIYNTGLPKPIIVFLLIMFIALTIGYAAIKIEQGRFHAALLKRVDTHFSSLPHNSNKVSNNLLVSEVMEEETLIMEESLTWKERFLSLKALHGGCMVVAWYQMFGRAAVTNPFHEFRCWTYPVAKNGTEGLIQYLPAHDPSYSIANNTQFTLMVVLPWVIVVPAVGLIWSYLTARQQHMSALYASLKK